MSNQFLRTEIYICIISSFDLTCSGKTYLARDIGRQCILMVYSVCSRKIYRLDSRSLSSKLQLILAFFLRWIAAGQGDDKQNTSDDFLHKGQVL